MDVSPFQRVLVAGFVAGGSEDLDANQETVRLLRSQLRTKSALKVIDADIMPLIAIAQDQNKAATADDTGAGNTPGAAGAPADASSQPATLPAKIKDENDLEPYERLFANTTYWKKLGEEYQNPLIVTGTILFMPNSTAGFVNRDVEEFDSVGRRRVDLRPAPTRSAKASSCAPSSSSSMGARAPRCIRKPTAKRFSTTRRTRRRRSPRISS